MRHDYLTNEKPHLHYRSSYLAHKKKTYNIYPPTLPLTPSNPLLILPPGDVAGCGRRKSTLMTWASLNLTSGWLRGSGNIIHRAFPGPSSDHPHLQSSTLLSCNSINHYNIWYIRICYNMKKKFDVTEFDITEFGITKILTHWSLKIAKSGNWYNGIWYNTTWKLI